MAITRAQQVRQMLKDGDVAIQGGVENYLGRQPEVQAPRKWQSGPDKPPTELAYITEAEKKLLLKEDIHGSLKEGPNEGPAGIMSLDSFGDIGGAGAAGGDTKASGGAKSDNVRFGPTQSGAGGINKPMSPADVKLEEQRLQTIIDNQEKDMPESDKQPFQVGNFLSNIFNPTAKRKAMYNASLFLPGSKDRITKYRKAYADYLESMGITPTDELLDTDNLYDFFDKQAFEKGKTINTGVGINELNQKIYDKLAEDMGPFSNDPLRNQFETLTQEEFMAQNPDLFSKGTPTEVQSYGDFILENFGSPGVKFSGDVGNKEVYVKGYREDGSKIYDVREKRDDNDGGSGMSDYERRLLELERQNAALKKEAETPTTTQNPFAYRFFADGGSADGIMDANIVGGMMDGNMDEMGRQMYGLGKLVKKATRGIKKIAKSPLGKVALLAGGAGLLSKAGFGLPSFLSKKGLSDFFFAGKDMALKNLTQKGLFTGLAGISALPLLFGQEEEDEYDPYRGPDIDIANIRSDPYAAMGQAYRFAADGGIMRSAYQEGGDAEPVAKKTMPLIDMDGKEKDYRETGGFVDMGRMERADDVPARLSKNEFVFTADAVRNAGEGDIDKGAEVMYNMMKNLEAGGEVSEESQGLEGARNMFQTSQRLGEVI